MGDIFDQVAAQSGAQRAKPVASQPGDIFDQTASQAYAAQSPLQKFAQGAWDTVKGTASQLWDAATNPYGTPQKQPQSASDYATRAAKDLAAPVVSAAKLAGQAVRAQWDELGRAGADVQGAWNQFEQGHYLGAAQTAANMFEHAGAAAVPVVGPTAANVIDTYYGNNTPGAPANPAQADPARASGQAVAALGTALAADAATSAFAPEAAAGAASTLKRSAQDQYATAVLRGGGPMSDKVRVARSVPQLIDDGVTALTRGGLQSKVNDIVSDFGQRIGNAVDNLPPDSSIPAADVYKALDDAAQARFTVENPSLGTGSQRVVPSDLAQGSLDQVSALKDIIRAGESTDANGVPVIDTRYLRNLRQNWDSIVDSHNGFTTNDLRNNAKVAAFDSSSDAVRDLFAQANPDIDALNKIYSKYRSVKTALDRSNLRKTGQSTPMGEQLAQAAGAAAGVARGSVGDAAGWAFALRGVRKLMTSTGWDTIGAVAKNHLANTLLKYGPKAASAEAETLMAATKASGALALGASQANQQPSPRKPGAAMPPPPYPNQ